MANDTPLLAVLIDADNTSHKHARAIFDEIASFGEASVRRIYGDFSSSHMKGWSGVQAEFGIVPHHQPANTVGKNASDIALVIDAMDLMHSGRFDGFVLCRPTAISPGWPAASASRGSTSTASASRRRRTRSARPASGSSSWRTSWGTGEGPEISRCGKGVDKRPMTEARDLIHRAMEGIEQEDDWYSLGQIGQYLTTANPDFDTRTYGKRKLSDLVESLKTLEVKRGPGNQLLVRRLD
jgi:hypothetical protein